MQWKRACRNNEAPAILYVFYCSVFYAAVRQNSPPNKRLFIGARLIAHNGVVARGVLGIRLERFIRFIYIDR